MKKNNLIWVVAIIILAALIYFFFKKQNGNGGGGGGGGGYTDYSQYFYYNYGDKKNGSGVHKEVIIKPEYGKAIYTGKSFPAGTHHLLTDVTNIAIKKTGKMPGVLAELLIKETYRKYPGWKIWVVKTK